VANLLPPLASTFEIVAIASSAGGLKALSEVLKVLPERSLSQSELVHFVRPSADLLFESTAGSFKERAIAVVLSGSGSDGAMGVRAIKNVGGTVLAQDEASSEFFGMPGAAIQSGSVDFILPLSEIAPALVTLVMKTEVE